MKKTIKTSTLIKKSYTVFNHESGLKIYLYKMPGFTSYYGLFGTKYGSIDSAFTDKNGNTVTLPAGIAHFLEHKLFESEDGDAFSKYAQTGAYSNAYTSFDRTCYLFSCSDRFYDNLKILLDFVRSPYFTAATVQKEQGIIGQEIRMYDDQPGWQVLFRMLGAMYKEHPVKVDIAGTVESISQITDKILYSCYERFYDLSNMFIILGGDFNDDEVIDFINKNLKISPSHEVCAAFPNEPCGVVKNYTECNLDVAKPMFCLGFKEDVKDENICIKHQLSVEILLKMLASSASPLYRTLLDKNLINEEFAPEYFTGRSFAIPMFEGESDEPKTVKNLIMEQIENYRRNGIDETLFDAVKRDMFGRGIRRFDGAESVCSMLCDAAVLNYDLFYYFDELKSITTDDIYKELSLFTEENAVLSVVNPTEKRN